MNMFKELKNNKLLSTKPPKNTLKVLGEKISKGVKKAGEIAHDIIDDGKELMREVRKATNETVNKGKDFLDNAAKHTIAVGEAGKNIIEGKKMDKIGAEYADTVLSKNSKEAAIKVVKHQMPQKMVTSARQVIVAPPSPLLKTILIEIISIYDGRNISGPECERASKYARFAAHSYEDLEDDVLPYGFKRIERTTTLENMRASIYSDNYEVVCAFAGSGWNIKDWENNATQVVGMSTQYDEALDYAKTIAERYPGKNIVFVGHSKGGGEAAYCAYSLGMQAETFNPAALSKLTKCKAHRNEIARINAYVYSTDILNKVQNLVGAEADGNVNYEQTSAIKHGIHGILGILRYYKIKYRKIKKKREIG